MVSLSGKSEKTCESGVECTGEYYSILESKTSVEQIPPQERVESHEFETE